MPPKPAAALAVFGQLAPRLRQRRQLQSVPLGARLQEDPCDTPSLFGSTARTSEDGSVSAKWTVALSRAMGVPTGRWNRQYIGICCDLGRERAERPQRVAAPCRRSAATEGAAQSARHGVRGFIDAEERRSSLMPRLKRGIKYSAALICLHDIRRSVALPLPVLHGERAGVRGCLTSGIRGGSPSPEIQALLEFRPLPASGAR